MTQSRVQIDLSIFWIGFNLPHFLIQTKREFTGLEKAQMMRSPILIRCQKREYKFFSRLRGKFTAGHPGELLMDEKAL